MAIFSLECVDCDSSLSAEVYGTWRLGFGVVFVHGVFDPITTYLAVVHYQAGVEANPIVAGALSQGALYFALFHLPLYAVIGACLCGFSVIYMKLSDERCQRLYELSAYLWWGLILWGVAVVGNNLYVIMMQ